MKRLYLKIAAILIVLALAAQAPPSPVGADAGPVAFRPLLMKGELDGKRFDKFGNGKEQLFVWKLRYISERDIAKVEMFWSATDRGRLLVGFTLNEDGAKRLRHFTAKFGMRHLAIFAGKRLINTIPAMPPMFMGDKIVVRWPGTEKELRALVTEVNRKPPGMIALYIEEQGKYNDYAADAWANLYSEVNRKISQDHVRDIEKLRMASDAEEG